MVRRSSQPARQSFVKRLQDKLKPKRQVGGGGGEGGGGGGCGGWGGVGWGVGGAPLVGRGLGRTGLQCNTV